ncbi:Fur family ferric uptake transcriptional regulator [Hymenobacter luteus]|uniref:Fur family ferric uptake transcriptional regulator n=2 Tax=Hymenobacter TaxID=89966 RepID=A0A7W9T5N6_9BACT|nr:MULTISPECIES: transcriptional repressor [Hymenobacter]MBB4603579.1 Fur family ferric uptake transcriptional regulator [Hymenobacter latericoloratus]MBB6061248.1 Fur family ferric uptake transcriptional regulator [Hymenobacter luteus]UYZ61291.1 transcriptional repressor [Hymenobacter sp. YIM 151858-1]
MAHPLEDTLIARQITPTPMRLLVLDVLQKEPTALSLADVEQHLKHADRITVHRTLKTFTDKGLVHRIEDGSGAVKFALCAPACTPELHRDLHVHFFCVRCRETACLPAVPVPALALPGGYQVQETSLVVKGHCPRCAGAV